MTHSHIIHNPIQMALSKSFQDLEDWMCKQHYSGKDDTRWFMKARSEEYEYEPSIDSYEYLQNLFT